MLVTIRVRSVVWFVTGAVVAVVVMLLVLDAWRVEAAPGDVDTTFVPVTACRLADTRQGGSPIGDGLTRTFSAHGVNGLCTVPSTAVALSMNVTVDSRTAANSFLTIWRAGVPRPNSSSLNPALGEPPTPNAVITDLSPGGQFNVYNDAGSVHVLFDVNGYYIKSSLADLNARAAGLESQVAALNAKLASVSVVTVDGQPTVRFSGVNVQVVDGSGDTDGPVNGRGNLIVGYNANASDTRTGSHNLIVGDAHSYSSYGGLVAGFNNTVSGIWSSVTAGRNNTASGEFSSVAGGVFSSATGEWSSVSGGEANIASGCGGLGDGWDREQGQRQSFIGLRWRHQHRQRRLTRRCPGASRTTRRQPRRRYLGVTETLQTESGPRCRAVPTTQRVEPPPPSWAARATWRVAPQRRCRAGPATSEAPGL